MKYYSLKKILKHNAQYNIIIGERSNGKTYAVLYHGLKKAWENGEQLAIIRRWRDDFVGKNGQQMFSALAETGAVAEITGGEFTNIFYKASRWYLGNFDDKGKPELEPEPIAYAFALTAMEHDKSTSYPKVTTVLFDEFMTRSGYLPDEFILFMNVLSTIIRQRDNVQIFMCANTVNKYCPYFKEMGLSHVRDMKQGTIEVYTYGESKLRVAVEYCRPAGQSKQSDTYFAFDNPKLNMIKSGVWELDVYPHCPYKYKPKDIVFKYFIQFDGQTLCCEIVDVDGKRFTFIHPHTKEFTDKQLQHELIYGTDFYPDPNRKRKITVAKTTLENRILWYYQYDKVFYADNETGEIVRNYLLWCRKN